MAMALWGFGSYKGRHPDRCFYRQDLGHRGRHHTHSRKSSWRKSRPGEHAGRIRTCRGGRIRAVKADIVADTEKAFMAEVRCEDDNHMAAREGVPNANT